MAEESKLAITSVTVSLEVKDMAYGNGSARFVTLTAKTPDSADGIPLEKLDDVLLQSLDMHLAAYQSLHAARFSDGVIKADDLNKCLTVMPRRLQKVRDFLASLSKASE